jgi:hypothetical protein
MTESFTVWIGKIAPEVLMNNNSQNGEIPALSAPFQTGIRELFQTVGPGKPWHAPAGVVSGSGETRPEVTIPTAENKRHGPPEAFATVGATFAAAWSNV